MNRVTRIGAKLEMSETTDQPEMSPIAAAAYGTFLWQLMKARPALKSLSEQAFDAKDRDAASALDEQDPNKMIYAMLASAGRGMRNEIDQSIRNNCAGAALQIAWTLFDAHLELLGVQHKDRKNVRCGCAFAGGEPFSRVLWASRNAFAHGSDWAGVGPTPAGEESIRILECVGFSNPTHALVYNYFALLSDGDVEIFIQRLQDAAKAIAAAQQTSVPKPEPWKSAISGLVSLLLLGVVFVVYFSSKNSNAEIDGVLLFQMGTGEDAKVIPLARGKISASPSQIQSAIEQAAIEGLSARAAHPFKELEARFAAWVAQADVLLKTDVGSERFYRDLLLACDQMEEIYQMALRLPSPVTLLLEEHGCKSIEDGQALLAELLEKHAGLTPEPFRIINTDLIKTGNASQSEANPDDI